MFAENAADHDVEADANVLTMVQSMVTLRRTVPASPRTMCYRVASAQLNAFLDRPMRRRRQIESITADYSAHQIPLRETDRPFMLCSFQAGT